MRKPRLRTLGNRIATLDTRTAKPPPKTADEVYNTPEHRDWAARVIAAAHGRCQDPNHKGLNPPPGRLYADHIEELKDGGAVTGRGMARCGSCHTLKTNAERTRRFQGMGV